MMTANRGLGSRLPTRNLAMMMRRIMLLLLVVAALTAFPVLAKAQSLTDSEDSPGTFSSSTPGPRNLTYTRPTHETKFRNYVFDVLGPYPVVGSAFTAGISQAYNSPPEWKQGAEGYAKRFVSDFGIAAVSTTTRYALAEALKEDTLYYRCECTGVFPRLSHAVTSTLIARRGADGHRVFSIPALVAPYAGTMTAVYVWYPGRYDAKDALRMGNYALLATLGWNIAREFLSGGPHSLFSRMHLNNGTATSSAGVSP